MRRTRSSLMAAALAVFAYAGAAAAQRKHVTIPFLANATHPGDLDFEGAECEIADDGATMRCEFQQVMLTVSTILADTCMVTTNRYELTFKKESATQWVSREGPSGPCGVIDVATLHDAGGVRWTKETRKELTNGRASQSCASVDSRAEVMSWQNLRRPLPCKFIQPSAFIP